MKKRLGAIPQGLQWITSDLAQEQLQKTEALSTSAQTDAPEENTRATFIMKQEYVDKIKAHAYWERVQIKDVIESMCEEFFKNKKIRSIPQKEKSHS